MANVRDGFTLAIPPGWTARGGGATTLVRSGDGGLAIAVASDRSDAGRAGPLAAYATATLRGLAGYRDLSAGAPRQLTGLRYPAEALDATGLYNATGVRQAIRVVALRREGQVTYTLIVFRNAALAAGRYAGATAELLKSFRGQAPPL